MGRRIEYPMGGMMQMKVARALGVTVDLYRVASNLCKCNISTIGWGDVEQNWSFLYVPIDIQFNHQKLPAFDEWIRMGGK